MKRFFSYAALVLALSCSLISCSKDDSSSYVDAIVTVKPTADGSFYLQLDNDTKVLPLNLSQSPFGTKQVRALTTLKDLKEMTGGECDASAQVCWIDSVLTKSPVLPLDSESGYGYGNDPIDILGTWTTVLEDNYLTLSFRAVAGPGSGIHRVNLVYGINPDDPYEVRFTHDMNDPSGLIDRSFTGIVAFDLTGIPGLCSEESATVTVRYRSAGGDERTILFSYPEGNAYHNNYMVTQDQSDSSSSASFE